MCKLSEIKKIKDKKRKVHLKYLESYLLKYFVNVQTVTETLLIKYKKCPRLNQIPNQIKVVFD